MVQLRGRPTLDEVQAPELVNLLADRRLAVLTGAGISTDSGIPDYRGPDSPPSNPMTIQQFLSGKHGVLPVLSIFRFIEGRRNTMI